MWHIWSLNSNVSLAQETSRVVLSNRKRLYIFPYGFNVPRSGVAWKSSKSDNTTPKRLSPLIFDRTFLCKEQLSCRQTLILLNSQRKAERINSIMTANFQVVKRERYWVAQCIFLFITQACNLAIALKASIT